MFKEIPTNCRYGYVRVSSRSQENNSSLESQKQELIQLAVPEKNIRVEVASAADLIQERPVFQKLIEEELQENDLLVVTKIDRCSRNTLDFLKLQERLHNKGVKFISLDLPYSNDMAVNQLISTNLAAIATFENERRKERQRQGIQAAKKNGKYLGRKTVITKKLSENFLALHLFIGVLYISRGDGSKSDLSSFVTPICLSKRKKFDLAFHRRLERYFPDWKEQMDYQKKQK